LNILIKYDIHPLELIQICDDLNIIEKIGISKKHYKSLKSLVENIHLDFYDLDELINFLYLNGIDNSCIHVIKSNLLVAPRLFFLEENEMVNYFDYLGNDKNELNRLMLLFQNERKKLFFIKSKFISLEIELLDIKLKGNIN
jgi:hypothetical protein